MADKVETLLDLHPEASTSSQGLKAGSRVVLVYQEDNDSYLCTTADGHPLGHVPTRLTDRIKHDAACQTTVRSLKREPGNESSISSMQVRMTWGTPCISQGGRAAVS